MANSFVAGTLVVLADGSYAAIEDVGRGDWVWAHDPVAGESGDRQVLDVIAGDGWKDLVTIGAGGASVTATVGHPFWLPVGEAWVDAGSLKAGDALLSLDGGHVEIEWVVEAGVEAQVYNLVVDGLHTYFVQVGGEDVLVHNCNLNLARHSHTLPDGRIRTYEPFRPASTPGEMSGARYVSEYNPATGGHRGWMATYDYADNVRIIHPKNGPYPHYLFDQKGLLIGTF